MNKLALATMAAAFAACLAAPAAWATDHEVMMLTKDSHGRLMQYEPAFLKVQPGDTVTFVSTDRSDNSESIPELIPQGAENWTGGLGQNVTVTFDQQGLYVYKCVHHLGRGMIGVVQVGDQAQPLDTAIIDQLPAKAQSRLKVLLTEAEAGGQAAK